MEKWEKSEIHSSRVCWDFKTIAIVYEQAKVSHTITQEILVILDDNKTKVKSRVLWKEKLDTLLGFCG